MNIGTSPSARQSSRLLERLRSLASAPSGSRVGFRAHDASPKREIALVAVFEDPDVAAMRRAVEAGVDGVEVALGDASAIAALVDAAKDLGVPLGVSLRGAVSAESAAEAAEAGIDWVRIGLDASLATAAWEQPARFLTVGTDLDLRLAAALNAPFAEAIVLEDREPAGPDLDLAAALRLRMLGEIVKKPLFYRVEIGLASLPATVFEHLGVNGLLVPGSDPSALAALDQSLSRVAARKGGPQRS